MLLDLAVAVGSVALSWLGYGALLVGAGLLFEGRPPARRPAFERVWLAFWLGFALTIALLQLWHFAAPITWRPLLALAPLAAWGFIRSRGGLRSLGREAVGRPGVSLAILACVLWCADRAIAPGVAQDSGLYHYPVITWNNAHAIVPGLGNLDPHLAYNNASLLYTAFLNTGAWEGRAQHLANGLLVAAFLAGSIGHGVRWLRGRSREPAVDAFLLAVAPLGATLALGKGMSSPTTDLALAILVAVAASRLLALSGLASSAVDAVDAPRTRAFDFLFVAVLASTGVCVKLSGAVVGVALWIAAAALYALRGASARTTLRTAAIAAALSAVLVLPWVARGLVLSGYPFFPSTFGAIAADWRVPEEIPHAARQEIRGFGRMELAWFIHRTLSSDPRTAPVARAMGMPEDREAAVGVLGWARPWLAVVALYTPIAVAAPLGIAVLTGLFALPRLGRARRSRGRADDPLLVALVFLPPLAGIAFWLATAPEPRFGSGAAWCLGGLAGALAVARGGARVRRGAAAVVLVLASGAFAHRALLDHLQRGAPLLATVPFVPPGPDHGFYALPRPRLAPFRTDHDLTVFVPIDRFRGLCWTGPLPCAPTREPALALRDPSRMGAGFRIERTD